MAPSTRYETATCSNMLRSGLVRRRECAEVLPEASPEASACSRGVITRVHDTLSPESPRAGARRMYPHLSCALARHRAQEEFRAVYMKAFPDTKPGDYDGVWAKIDVDGDNNLTVKELAKFYGFDTSSESTNDMSDDQILAALQMQVTMEDAKDEKEKEEAKSKEKETKTRDTTISIINVEKKKKEVSAEEGRSVEFMELVQLGDLVSLVPWPPPRTHPSRPGLDRRAYARVSTGEPRG